MSNQTIFSNPDVIKKKYELFKESLLDNRMMSPPELNNLYMDLYGLCHDVAPGECSSGCIATHSFESPFVVFYCTPEGKRIIEECYDIMNRMLISMEIPPGYNVLTIGVKTKLDYYWHTPNEVNTKVLVWSYDFKKLLQHQPITEGLRSQILTAFYHAFHEGFGIE